MGKILSILLLTLAFSGYLYAAPAGWLTDAARAREYSANYNLPIMILFSGGSWDESSAAFENKLAKSGELSDYIRKNCIPLYVELPKASDWTGDYKKNLQKQFPFVDVQSGIPLPSIFFADSKFQNLNVREPQFTLRGYQKAIRTAKKNLAASSAADLKTADEISGQGLTGRRHAQLPKKNHRNTGRQSIKNSPAQNRPDTVSGQTYSVSSQAKEADRQRSAYRESKRKPPRGWFTDPEKAKEFAASRKLPIVILFSGTDWCKPCQKLHDKVLSDRKVRNLILSGCVGLYVNVPAGKWEQPRRKYPFWKAQGVPSMVITTPEFKVIRNVFGYDLWTYQSLKQIISASAGSLK